MAERRPISPGYHPVGLLAAAGIGLAVGLFDIFVNDPPLRVYAIAAALIIPLQLLQVWLDYRHTEQWYAALTTVPFEPALPERLRLVWPALLSFATIFFVGPYAFAAVSLATLVFSYPGQRALYRRSYREFKSPAPKVFGLTIEKWGAIRARGRKQVVLHGAIYWTFFCFLVICCANVSSHAWISVATAILLLPISFAVNLWMASRGWENNERKYLQHTGSSTDSLA